MIGGGRPLLPEILDQSDRFGAKSPIFALFSLVATQEDYNTVVEDRPIMSAPPVLTSVGFSSFNTQQIEQYS